MKIKKSDLWLILVAIGVVALSFVLNGCATTPKRVVPDLPANVAAKQNVTVDEQLIAPCTPLVLLDIRPYSESDTLDPVSAWANAYTDCSGRFARYVEITSKLLNINTITDAQKAASDASATSK